ncbi:MAG: NUDIX hydrolase [Bacteroidetes bacterium]|nr:NUDIX hydrolase [Bacteroidota bacterium]
MAFTYPYPRPALTVDAVIVAWHAGRVLLLLVRRKHPPFEGHWAIPGGFVQMDEPLEQAAARELAEETGLSGIALKQFYTYGDPMRDPRHRTVTVVYVGRINEEPPLPDAGDDAAEAAWFDMHQLPELAFDHRGIIGDVINSLNLNIQK